MGSCGGWYGGGAHGGETDSSVSPSKSGPPIDVDRSARKSTLQAPPRSRRAPSRTTVSVRDTHNAQRDEEAAPAASTSRVGEVVFGNDLDEVGTRSDGDFARRRAEGLVASACCSASITSGDCISGAISAAVLEAASLSGEWTTEGDVEPRRDGRPMPPTRWTVEFSALFLESGNALPLHSPILVHVTKSRNFAKRINRRMRRASHGHGLPLRGG